MSNPCEHGTCKPWTGISAMTVKDRLGWVRSNVIATFSRSKVYVNWFTVSEDIALEIDSAKIHVV